MKITSVIGCQRYLYEIYNVIIYFYYILWNIWVQISSGLFVHIWKEEAYSVDHSDSEKGNLLTPLHGLLFLSFYMHHPRQDSTYHGRGHTSHGALAGTRSSSMGPT